MALSNLNWGTWIRCIVGRLPAKRSVVRCAVLQPEQLEDRALLSASSSMSGGRWTINADVDAVTASETIVVDQAPDDASRIRVTINGSELDDRLARRVKSITINAGSGDDTVTVQLPAALSRILVTVNGGGGDDTLNAGSNRAILRGGEGNDILNGSANNDQLFGGLGDDILNGNGGDDLLQGDNGEDTLMGGLGADRLRGGAGKDWVYSSPGTDTIVSDSEDVVTSEQADGIQQFETEAEFLEWLSHSDFVSQQMGSGPIFNTMSGPFVDFARADDVAVAGASHSETNTQEAGVDEQDIIETDGDYIYTVRGTELLIIDVRQPADANIVSRVQLSGWGAEMYLDGDRLTVISTVNQFSIHPLPFEVALPEDSLSGLRIAYPGWYWHPQTRVSTYDISDRENLKVLEDTTLDGSVQTSRSVDGRIYLVVNNGMWARYPYLLDVITTNVDTASVSGASLDDIKRPFEEWSKFIPQYTTRSYDASGNVTVTSGSLLDAPNIWATEDGLNNGNMMTIAMFDIHQAKAGIDSTSTVIGLSGDVYASEDALYVASQKWQFSVAASLSGPSTLLYKFDLSTAGSDLVATGEVDGTIINQFAMDEHDGYFRIATTSNQWQSNQSSNVFVLQQQGKDLVTVSSLTGLAPTERIQAARFIGDHVYLSTFLRVDPLFNIDLSDPLAIKVVGELKVPGFSSYLQAWGDDYLVSIGQDADPETGIVTGLQLSLFDVSGDQPVLIDTYKIGVSAWSAYSQAQWDHHAFSLFEAEGILAIPVSHWDSNSDYGTELQVFQLNGETGFELLGIVEHDSQVMRSLRIGDQLFSLSDSSLKINLLADPDTEVGEVKLVDINLPQPEPFPEPFPEPIPFDPPLEPVLPVKSRPVKSVPAKNSNHAERVDHHKKGHRQGKK